MEGAKRMDTKFPEPLLRQLRRIESFAGMLRSELRVFASASGGGVLIPQDSVSRVYARANNLELSLFLMPRPASCTFRGCDRRLDEHGRMKFAADIERAFRELAGSVEVARELDSAPWVGIFDAMWDAAANIQDALSNNDSHVTVPAVWLEMLDNACRALSTTTGGASDAETMHLPPVASEPGVGVSKPAAAPSVVEILAGSRTAAISKPIGEPSIESKALAMLAERPDITTVAGIANAIGCSRAAIYKQPRFMAAWEIHKGNQKTPGRIRRGQKNRETGDVEAYDEVSTDEF